MIELGGISVEWLAFLFSVALLASFLDTLAGGGGLLTVPALMMSGLPPLSALATNKLQSSVGTGTATFVMLRSKRVRFNDVKRLMLAAFVGSLIGTLTVQLLDTSLLSVIIPFVLLVIAIYFLLSPTPKETDQTPKLSVLPYQNTVVPSIGFYDGMFGPGTGSFFALAGVSLRGQGLLKSTAVAKTLNFSTNIASLLVFLLAGQVVWSVGFVMMFGQVIGAYLGAHSLFKIKPKYLRMLIVVVCLTMLAKYLASMPIFMTAGTL